MKTRKPPYALVSVLLVLIGVAVVMGGRMMALNNDTNSEELKAALDKKEEGEQRTQLTPVKPGELRDAAKARSSPRMPDTDLPKPKLNSAIPKVKDNPPPKPNETSNRSLRGY